MKYIAKMPSWKKFFVSNTLTSLNKIKNIKRILQYEKFN